MKKLAVVDISSFIFRAFYAVRPLHSPEGIPTNAVYGVYNMLYKLFAELKPTHIFLAKDSKEDTFRHEIYSEYKANRDLPPEELVPQFGLIHELVDKMHLKSVAIPRYEADDVIASVVVQWKSHFDEILIVSSDKDLMQFVDGVSVFMVDTMKDVKIGPKEVFERLSVYPEQVVDYLSMVGDASDNIPGMEGIGAKTASKLLEEYKSLEQIIENKEKLVGKKLVNAFTNHIEDALLSRRLVTLKTDLKLNISPQETRFNFIPDQGLIHFLQEKLGFKTASRKLEDLVQKEQKSPQSDFQVIKVENFAEIGALTKKNSMVAIHTEYNSLDFFDSEISFMALTFDGIIAYFMSGAEQINAILQLLYENKELIGHHFKRDLRYRLRKGYTINAQIFDLTQAHYALDSDGNHDFEYLCKKYLDITLIQRDRKDPCLAQWDMEKVVSFVGERAIYNFRLAEKLKSALRENDLLDVYQKVDKPMIQILAQMELNGILLDKECLKELEGEFTNQTYSLVKAVKESVSLSGNKLTEDFNLRSPKQVGELLFETLNLPIIKTTKTGFSTDSSVLEELDRRKLSEVPGIILMYREIDKLLGTYVKALPMLVHAKTQRLHTLFSLHTAATGRLSSINPNLQNIPVRTENGRKIRKAFVAAQDHVLLSADYSQVELRLLAHFSKDPTMLLGFKKGIDIHAQTASEIMGIKIEEVGQEERAKAKAVNFGLMYGQSSFGLAEQMKISRAEAREYINRYFQKFGKIKGYLDKLKETAAINGYSSTLFGRKRFLPDLKSQNRTVKSSAERLAINSPIQGTAADILKMAMIRIQGEMDARKLTSKMLLQVHDELIFEVKASELDAMKKLVQEGMENVVKLEVPLKVEMGIGANWLELK